VLTRRAVVGGAIAAGLGGALALTSSCGSGSSTPTEQRASRPIDLVPPPDVGRRPVSRFPRVGVSPDPLVPKRPVPAAPAPAVVRPLGSCCSESRGGSRIDAIVLHATEFADRSGNDDLVRLARFFKRSQLGVHVADNAEGDSSRMVPDALMAYHATYWNAATLGIEQMGFSSFDREQWLARRAQLDATARWVAHWARQYRIPIRRCVVTGLKYNRDKRVVAGRIVRRGICSHAQLDPRNRDDPGPGYPWDSLLARARAKARAAG
jgi:hypothetical protein